MCYISFPPFSTEAAWGGGGGGFMSCGLCVLLVWSDQVFVACSGPWILGRKVRCAP